MELITNTSLICMVILALMVTTSRPRSTIDPRNGRQIRYATLLVFAFGLVLTFVSAFRKEFQDTSVYKEIYAAMGTDYDYAFDENLAIQDYGFNLFMVFLNRIDPDPQTLIIVCSCIIIPSFVYTLGKYAQDLPFSLLLLLCTSYISSMNGIRQVLAGAVLLLALPWIRDRLTIPYIVLVWVLSNFHGSILILIPLYFVISGKRLNMGIWLFLILVVACFAMPNMATSVIGTLLEDSIYADYLDNDSHMGLMRFLTALAPTLLSLLYCWVQAENHHGEDKHSPRYHSQRMTDILINMQIVSFGFTTLGMRMVYFARVSMYFTCALPLVLPVVIKGCFRPRSARTISLIVIGMYIFYYAFQIYTYHSIGGWNGFVLNL